MATLSDAMRGRSQLPRYLDETVSNRPDSAGVKVGGHSLRKQPTFGDVTTGFSPK